MSVTDLSEEFIVSQDKVELIDKLKAKVERLYGTRIYFQQVSRCGEDRKRWIQLTGGKWDIQNAKTYILGLCDPEETKVVKCNADFLDEEIIENIEKTTQAVLFQIPSGDVKITGNELSVTLALSALEDLTGCTTEIVDSGVNADADVNTRNRSASDRLNEKLKQTFGEHSESFQNYSDSIKRVLLESSTYESLDSSDIPEDKLHGSWSDAPLAIARKSSSEVIMRAKEGVESRRNVTEPIYQVDSVEHMSHPIGQVVADGMSERNQLEDVFSVADQLTSAAQISPQSKQAMANGHVTGPAALRKFARKVGYTHEEVDEGFLYVKTPMMPKDFLEVLRQVKEGKEKLGLGKDSGNNQDNESNRGNAKDVPGVNEVVTIDSETEEENESDLVIIEDHFSIPLKGQAATQKDRFGVKHGLTPKEKKLNEQKQKDLEREYNGKKATGLKKKNKSPPTQPGTKRKSDPDSDPEQTSVLKIWEPIHVLPEKVAPSQVRQQRLVGPLPTPPSLMSVDVPKPTVDRQWIEPQQRLTLGPAGPPVNTMSSPSNSVCGKPTDLRYVIIDGSNVAMCHGKNKLFSCKGIQIAVDYFLDRGHKVTVFVPEWRKYRNYYDNKIRDQEILQKLEDSEHLVFTPSRKIQGRLVASYDDRYILALAEKEDSIILSNDQYRDLMREKASWKQIIEERLLMYRFVGDHFMPAEDPLGRDGPMLEDFLKKQAQSPTRVFYQTEFNNGQKNWRGGHQSYFPRHPFQPPQRPLPPQGGLRFGNHGNSNQSQGRVQMLGREQTAPKRHDTVTKQLLAQLKLVFSDPSQEDKVKQVLENHSNETDLNRLTNYCMEVMFS